MRYVVDLVIYGLQCVMVVGLTWFRIVLVALCVCLEWWLLFVGVAWRLDCLVVLVFVGCLA